MRITASVLDNEMLILPDVNIVELGTSNGTTTDEYGKFSINVASADSELQFRHAAYEFVTYRAGDINDDIVYLEPETLDGVTVTGNSTKKDNTVWYVLAGIAVLAIGAKMMGKKNVQPRRVKV